MSQILSWLSGSDRRSDGVSDEVVKCVLDSPDIFDDLFLGLFHTDEVIRGRTADALEKIGRSKPELFIEQIPEIISSINSDSNSTVRFHLAMLLGHLSIYEQHVQQIIDTLLVLLNDKSAFVKSWSITSLCIINRLYPKNKEVILNAILPLENDPKIAVRTRVRYALAVLLDDKAQLPAGWIKSEVILGNMKAKY